MLYSNHRNSDRTVDVNAVVKARLHDTTCRETGCQTLCTARFDNQLNEQRLFVQHGCQTGSEPV